MRSIKLLVGLGNPGPEYAATRHNAGYWFVDQVADRLGVGWREDAKFSGAIAQASLDGQNLWLLKPNTYMNASGRSVVAMAVYYKIMPDEILVVHDDLDLLPGVIKLKHGGGHGGHNGLKDIANAISTSVFWRLRVGIGHPGEKENVARFVLHAASKPEQELMDAAMDEALALYQPMLNGHIDEAMRDLHAPKSR